MKGKALRGLVGFGIILLAIWIAWWFNFSPDPAPESPSLEDSILRGRQRAEIARDSAHIADTVYTASEGDLKWMINEINNNTPTAAMLRDSLRAVLKARAYADSINRK